MCGLAGVFTAGTASADEAVVARMCEALVHRGPDAGGLWSDPEAGIALGHRRLSIIDLSPTGAQPMASADGRYVIVYNGELYNYPDLRAALDARGHIAWRGTSDTEVLLEAICVWGVAATLVRAEGQFAFALWDRQARELTLARDRFGEKPLYWGFAGRSLIFGSELKALRRHPDFDSALDPEAVATYLRHAYIPHPLSIYRSIRKLAPGAMLTARGGEGGRPQVEHAAYWSLAEAVERGAAGPFPGSDDEAAETLDGLLRQSVRARMVADVPLGALLSGGIDSSAVVALMQAQSSRPVQTFTIGSWDKRLNEAEHARDIAERLGTEHTELYVGDAEALAVAPRLAAMFDEPFADSSQIPTHLISQLARRSVTVALSGDGGDELFGGYNRHQLGSQWAAAARIPRPLRLALAQAVQTVPPDAWSALVQASGRLAPGALRGGPAGDKLHKWAGKMTARDSRQFLGQLLSTWDGAEAALSNPTLALDILAEPPPPAAGRSFAETAMYYDARYYLSDDILAKVDRASMATSLEVRAPYLDTALFEFAWSLPLSFKIRDGRGKQVLRRVLGRYLPAEVLDRPKRGFAVPIADWLRGPLRDWAAALLQPAALADAGLRAGPVMALWREHLSGRRNWDVPLWTVLMLLAWQAEG